MSLAPNEVEDDEVIEKGKYVINGKEVEVDRILKDGKNFPELRDIAEALGYSVGYDAVKKLPVLAKK